MTTSGRGGKSTGPLVGTGSSGSQLSQALGPAGVLTRRSIANSTTPSVSTDSQETAPLTAVPHRSLSDDVTDQLREAIVTGRLRPGQHLREAEISQALQVSRSPVRDAFAQLGHEGLVTIRSHRGAVVVGLSAGDIEEVYTLRTSLEGLAVRLAIQRASEADFVRLKDLADRIPETAANLSPRDYAELDVSFHDLVYQMAQHDRLYACWAMLRSHIFRFLMTRNLVNPDFSDLGHREHVELVDTMAAHDTDRALEMIRSHLEGAYARLVAGYVAPVDHLGARAGSATPTPGIAPDGQLG